jgi:hypothetical protein
MLHDPSKSVNNSNAPRTTPHLDIKQRDYNTFEVSEIHTSPSCAVALIYRVRYSHGCSCNCTEWLRTGNCPHCAAVRHWRDVQELGADIAPKPPRKYAKRIKLAAIVVKPAPRLTVESDAEALERTTREHEARQARLRRMLELAEERRTWDAIVPETDPRLKQAAE